MSLKNKIYEDYLKKSRLPEYHRTLQVAREHGYQMVGVLDFARKIRSGDFIGQKIYLNRHDIDTSPRVAAEMFAIEKEVFGTQGSATYYFRETTTDKKLIHEIDEYGYETGYHYEELATYAKTHKLKSREAIKEHILDAGMILLRDLDQFRKSTGSPSLTIASHGDFINTRYNIQSYEMLRLKEIRENAKIEAEAYDEDIMQYIQERFADQKLIASFSEKAIHAFEQEIPIVMTLTHPRNWKVDVPENTVENWRRISQDLSFRI